MSLVAELQFRCAIVSATMRDITACVSSVSLVVRVLLGVRALGMFMKD